ncbi:MAG: hypothetical protein KatS3mg033_0886 [Thermonema sp.]|uniref:hypothetical protein n=1 Tax=Thermonema sp. TaxID=2231181 RepID=UPI0021DBA5DB|nr:hypothetical protein [Thermonema sp.]GIV39086.1 MAG: hypothetical protein KatS3mg033_0886 [Thermonema sp.]
MKAFKQALLVFIGMLLLIQCKNSEETQETASFKELPAFTLQAIHKIDAFNDTLFWQYDLELFKYKNHYLITSNQNHFLVVTDTNFRIVGYYGKYGQGPGEFGYPGKVFAIQDTIYVEDGLNGEFDVFHFPKATYIQSKKIDLNPNLLAAAYTSYEIVPNQKKSYSCVFNTKQKRNEIVVTDLYNQNKVYTQIPYSFPYYKERLNWHEAHVASFYNGKYVCVVGFTQPFVIAFNTQNRDTLWQLDLTQAPPMKRAFDSLQVDIKERKREEYRKPYLVPGLITQAFAHDRFLFVCFNERLGTGKLREKSIQAVVMEILPNGSYRPKGYLKLRTGNIEDDYFSFKILHMDRESKQLIAQGSTGTIYVFPLPGELL